MSYVKAVLIFFYTIFIISCNPLGNQAFVGDGFAPGNTIGNEPSSSIGAPQAFTIIGRGNEQASPLLHWVAPAASGTGLHHFEVAIGTSPGVYDILSWSTVPGGSSATNYIIQNGVDGFSLSLNYETTYYIALKAVDNSAMSSEVEARNWQIPWTPRAFGNQLKFWFDGSDASTMTLDGSVRVSQWIDKSNNGFFVTQATAANRPSLVNFLNAKGLVFDTTTKGLSTATATSLLDANGFSAYFVQQTPNAGTWRSLLSTYSTQSFALYSTSSGTAYRFYNGVHTTTTLQSSAAQVVGYIALPSSPFIDRRDGTQTTTAAIAATTLPSSGFAIGNYLSTNQSGTAASTIGEVIVLESSSNLASWEKIEGYLAHKWNLQGNLPLLHPYKTTAP